MFIAFILKILTNTWYYQHYFCLRLSTTFFKKLVVFHKKFFLLISVSTIEYFFNSWHQCSVLFSLF
jgi:hypothetical protein